MKIKSIVMCLAVVACSAVITRAQEAPPTQSTTEQPVALAQKAVALDGTGREALAASLLTNTLQGTPEAPIKNIRFVVENRGAVFYTYVSGTITFYREDSVRCGEGSFTLSSLAPGETAETDAPGLRLECAPSSWRMVATNLLPRSNDALRPVETQPQSPAQPVSPPPAPSALYLTIDGQQYQVPLNSTLEIPVRRRRIKITLSDQP